jgi:hypothetical protein
VRSRFRVIPSLLVAGIVLAGGGSVIAASGGSSSSGSSAKDQYCPPNSPNGGNPQGGPNNNCGNPPDNCPNGQPKPPSGNCGNGNPGGPPEKKKKKPKFTIHRHPNRSCYRGNISFRIGVTNRPRSHRTFVYRDGKLLKTSRSKAFKLHFNTSRLRRGNHTLKVMTRGSDGKFTTRTFHFRRC